MVTFPVAVCHCPLTGIVIQICAASKQAQEHEQLALGQISKIFYTTKWQLTSGFDFVHELCQVSDYLIRSTNRSIAYIVLLAAQMKISERQKVKKNHSATNLLKIVHFWNIEITVSERTTAT